MGRRVLLRHIWGYSVCLCSIKGTPGLNELSNHLFHKLNNLKFCHEHEHSKKAAENFGMFLCFATIPFDSTNAYFYLLSSVANIHSISHCFYHFLDIYCFHMLFLCYYWPFSVDKRIRTQLDKNKEILMMALKVGNRRDQNVTFFCKTFILYLYNIYT